MVQAFAQDQHRGVLRGIGHRGLAPRSAQDRVRHRPWARLCLRTCLRNSQRDSPSADSSLQKADSRMLGMLPKL